MVGEGLSSHTAQGLLDLMLWTGESLMAAELTPDGVVRRANGALLARAPGLVGQPIHAVVTPADRALVDAGLRGAGAGWSSVRLGLFPDEDTVPAEHRVWISGSPEKVLVVAEPAESAEERVIDVLVSLDDELIRARRADRALMRERRDHESDRRLLAGWAALSAP
ncbi:MAG TPA: hypothetical protein VN213_16280, partial [Solirubrobacteraceae bacterium]|nr:hypothetical protein [Solirubrobacteraceae bacterium]